MCVCLSSYYGWDYFVIVVSVYYQEYMEKKDKKFSDNSHQNISERYNFLVQDRFATGKMKLDI